MRNLIRIDFTKKINYTVIMALTLSMISCNDVLEPVINQSDATRQQISNSAGDNKHDVLGYGYDPTVEYLNISTFNWHQVIDVDRFYNENPEYFFQEVPRIELSYIYAGSNAVGLSEKMSGIFADSTVIDQPTSLIKQDLLLDNYIAADNSYATYIKTISIRREAIFQSADVLKNYLTSGFTTAIANSSESEIIRLYGTHVFTDITIGGKLQVDYRSKIDTNVKDKESAVNSGISAAIKRAFNCTAINSEGVSSEYLNKNTRCLYKMTGGARSIISSGAILDPNKSYKDELNAWSESVNTSNAQIIRVGEGSLIPIYEFVSDPAKKQVLKAAVLNYLESKKFKPVNNSIKCGFGLNKTTDRILPLDYNGDGITDILCYSPGNQSVFLNKGLGNGTFINVYASLNGLGGYNFANTSDRAIILDYNGDSKDDIMCYRPGSKFVWILKSNGDGTFTKIYSNNTSGIGGYNFSNDIDRAISLDYNGDGKDDLMCYRAGSKFVWILKSNGDGTFTPVYTSNTAGIGGYSFASVNDQVIAFDYNRDNYDDLFCYRPGSKHAWILKSNGDGTFTSVYSSNNGIGSYNFANKNDEAIALDYNGDGKDDLLCFRPGSKYAHLIKSNGNTSFTTIMQSNSGIAGFNLSNIHDKIIALDYNNDKRSDLILYRPGKNIIFAARATHGDSFEKDDSY